MRIPEHRLPDTNCEYRDSRFQGLGSVLLPPGAFLGVGAGPILEFIAEEFAAQIDDVLLQPRLGIRNGLVVDHGADLFDKEIEQQAGGQIADGIG